MDRREFLAVQGMSIRALARMINYDHAYLSRVLSGKQTPSPQLVAALELAGVERIEPTVPSMADHLADLRRSEDLVGVGKVREHVLSSAKHMIGLADEARGGERREMVGLAAQWCSYSGWIELESGRTESSRKLFDRGIEYAFEAGDATLGAHIWSYKGYLAGRSGNASAMEGLSAASRRLWPTHPAQAAYNAFQHARALALIGENGKAGEALDAATTLADASEGEEPLVFAYWYTRPFFLLTTGFAHLELGHLARARDLLADGLESLPDDQKSADWVQEFRDAHARTG